MNFCTKCGSYYSAPGTCNCFASQRQPAPQPGTGTNIYIPPVTTSITTTAYPGAVKSDDPGIWYVYGA